MQVEIVRQEPEPRALHIRICRLESTLCLMAVLRRVWGAKGAVEPRASCRNQTRQWLPPVAESRRRELLAAFALVAQIV